MYMYSFQSVNTDADADGADAWCEHSLTCKRCWPTIDLVIDLMQF